MSEELPKVEIIREDLAESSRLLAQKIVKEADDALRREPPRQEGPTKYEVRVTTLKPRLVKASTVEPVPFGIGVIQAYGHSEASALATLRLQYGRGLLATKLVRTWDDARDRAADIVLDVVERG